ERGRVRLEPDPVASVPQRPAERELPPGRGPRVHRGLRVRGDGGPVLRPGEPRHQARLRGPAGRGPPRRLLRRGDPRAPRPVEVDEGGSRLLGGDVGGAPAGHLHARLRLRGVRGDELRPMPRARGRRSVRAVAARGGGFPVSDEAQAVIVGGGVAGASIAYHLTKMGWRDVVLVDRNELTSGSTFHSAGLVGQLRSTVTLTRMMMYGVELYRRLAEETERDPGWHEVGSLRLASSDERMEERSRLSGWGQTFGLPREVVSTE